MSFLDVKFPLLERVEKRNREIQEERHNILQGRRFEAHAAELAVWTKRPVLADYASLKQLPSAEESESPPPLQNQRFVSPMESAPITVVLTQSEKSDLASAAESLSREEEGVLADVTSDDWRDPSGSTGAAGQFRRWKEKFPDEYKLVGLK